MLIMLTTNLPADEAVLILCQHRPKISTASQKLKICTAADLHKLLLRFAESRVAAMSRAQGWEAGPGQLGKVMGEIRRALSVTVVRANALCLFERLSQLGPGARAAAKRRQGTLLLEERRR